MNNLQINSIRCNKFATARSSQSNMLLLFCRTHGSPIFICWSLLLRFFDSKQLLWVSCFLWCYYPKCYSIILENASLWCFIVILNWQIICTSYQIIEINTFTNRLNKWKDTNWFCEMWFRIPQNMLNNQKLVWLPNFLIQWNDGESKEENKKVIKINCDNINLNNYYNWDKENKLDI